MTHSQAQQGMLVISDDNFLIGVLTGLSVANHFSFRSVSLNDPLSLDLVSRVCKVVLIDLRTIRAELLASHVEVLHRINHVYKIPVCAVLNQCNSKLTDRLPWIEYFTDVDLIAKLDSYLPQISVNHSTLRDERRHKERRSAIDRRGISAILGLERSHHTAQVLKDFLPDEEMSFVLGPFVIDNNSRTVHCHGKNIMLTAKEFKLFTILAQVHDHVCSTEKIIENLWPDTRRANKSDLYQYMHLLRKKVEVDPDNPRWILTVKGVGYRLNTNTFLS
ncbi:DNA-binding response regulator MtrA [Paraglaciecola mesophila]|uniref:DNA-binding response regulator MtrA n=2 Tax=Paraglaciecola mesophila TaxID=197222 RepID=A0A857JEV8_9ALTE|nr:DNA-binding response regulator MtrA [Paraglaciecola mesophila]